MPYTVLESKLKEIPEQYIPEIADFIDYIQFKARQYESQKKKPRLGAAKGKFVCPDDIDFCNDEIAEMFGVNE